MEIGKLVHTWPMDYQYVVIKVIPERVFEFGDFEILYSPTHLYAYPGEPKGIK
jgi:hypothetical protein